jgi:hypothetical protein
MKKLVLFYFVTELLFPEAALQYLLALMYCTVQYFKGTVYSMCVEMFVRKSMCTRQKI